jgi:hypothetical protein
VRLILAWGTGFGVATTLLFLVAGDPLIDAMTSSPEVRDAARHFMLFAALAPAAGVLAYAYDGIYIGATWARDMRNLMVAALAIYFAAWWTLAALGNAGLWWALLIFLLAPGADAHDLQVLIRPSKAFSGSIAPTYPPHGRACPGHPHLAFWPRRGCPAQGRA